ncbi:MAG: hypothetical protein H8E82_08855 [Candidatus Marinimicrobia bacterium]|nr:hypothetical protein [Candidatus Neomarinimicrobiota bacterium]
MRYIIFLFLFGIRFVLSQVFYTPWMEYPLPEKLSSKGIIPKILTVNQFGDIYLLDDENYWLVWISKEKPTVRVAGGWGTENEMFNLPTDLHTSTGLDIYLCDNTTHRLLRFDKKLNFIAEMEVSNLSPIPIRYPYQIASNFLGELLIVSSETWEISLLSVDGQFVTPFGDVSYGRNRFNEIEDIAVNPRNDVGIVDIGSGLFYELTRSGLISQNIPLPDSRKFLVQWCDLGWLLMDAVGILYFLNEKENSFVEIPQLSSDVKTLNVLDFDVVGDILYIIDDINSIIYTSTIKQIE